MGLEGKREERGGRERYGRLSLFRPLLFVFGSARANQTTGDQNFRTLFDPCDPIKANATATLFDNLFSPNSPLWIRQSFPPDGLCVVKGRGRHEK